MMAAEESHDLPTASSWPKETGAVVPVQIQRPENHGSQCVGPNLSPSA